MMFVAILIALQVLSAQEPLPAPTTMPSPPPTVAEARSAVEGRLGKRYILIQLDAPLYVRYRYYDDLAKAGILQSYVAPNAYIGPTTEYRLTAKGRTLVAKESWALSHGAISIPVGNLKLVKIAVQTEKGQSYSGEGSLYSWTHYWADYAFVGSLNATGRSLLAFGPARDWVIERMYPIACKTTVATLGRVRTESAQLINYQGTWEAEYARSWGTPLAQPKCKAGESPSDP